MAQGRLKQKLDSARRGGVIKSSDDESGNQRNDFEGVVWEFKIIDRNQKDKSKQAKLTGRLRVKQSAVFSVGKVEVSQDGDALSDAEEAKKLMKEFDKNRDAKLSSDELTAMVNSMRKENRTFSSQTGAKKGNDSSDLKSDLKGLMSQRVKGAKQADMGGGARIGDLTKQSLKNCVFEFDQDDDHPLSGRAELKPDSKKKGGVWTGNYYEYVNGKKGERWRIEMRKIDE